MPRTCTYIAGDPRIDAACGKPVPVGQKHPYCSEHLAIVYHRVPMSLARIAQLSYPAPIDPTVFRHRVRRR